MKRIQTAINETEYTQFKKITETLNVTEYKVLNLLIKEFIASGTIDKQAVNCIVKNVRLQLEGSRLLEAVYKDLKTTKKNLF